MQAVLRTFQAACRTARQLWPYLMLELLMPGGSLMALLLFLHRRGKLVPVLARCRNRDAAFDYRTSSPLVTLIRSKP
jgi:hypothetical protein